MNKFLFLGFLLCTSLIGAQSPSYNTNNNYAPSQTTVQYCPCGCGCVAPCYCGCMEGKPCNCQHNNNNFYR